MADTREPNPIPEEAVQAADNAWINSEGLYGKGQMDHALAAAYPILAAQVRREAAEEQRAAGMVVVSAEDLDIVMNRGDQVAGWSRFSDACDRLRAALPESDSAVDE